MTNRFQPLTKDVERPFSTEVGELFPKALQIPKRMLIDKTHEAVEFKESVLKGGRGQKQFLLVLQRSLECVRDYIRRLVDVPQPVGFVDHYKIPRHGMDVCSLVPGKLVRANDNRVGRIERAE